MAAVVAPVAAAVAAPVNAALRQAADIEASMFVWMHFPTEFLPV